MIAIFAATPLETPLLRSQIQNKTALSCGPFSGLKGIVGDHSVALFHTGVGKSAAAALTSAVLSHLSIDTVMIVGCAGAYPHSGLQVGDLTLATEEVFGDEGVMAPEGFLDMEQLGFALVSTAERSYYNRIPAPAATAPTQAILEAFSRTHRCRFAAGAFVTVSCCSGTDALSRQMHERTNGVCENMEGAAIAQACTLFNRPWLEIRGISNLVENRNLTRWNLKKGVDIAQKALLDLLSLRRPSKETNS